MPPKKKITKTQIIQEAYDIVCQEGKEKLNARYLAKKLNCSTQPIFSSFTSMDELMEEVKKKALDLYHIYIEEGLKYSKPFLGSGLAYIKFAKEQSNLFKLLYMDKTNQSFDNVKIDTNEDKELIENAIESSGLSIENVKMMHLMSWIFVHGIASMIATGSITYPDEMIEQLLIDFYQGCKKQFEGKKK